MSQPVAVDRYLQKRAVQGPWRIEGTARRDFSGAVVIPALAESDSLFKTLESLAANPPDVLERFLVLVVVNHRQDADAAVKQDNERTLRRLAATASLPALAWVDAAGGGLELSGKDGGVGLARKIGLDLALRYLDWNSRPLLVCLDADTLVRPDYLSALRAHFAVSEAGAAVVPFCHPVTGDAPQQAAIVAYELYLRSHVLGLELAGSPYAFHTVGSTIACRAGDYARAGGMNRRQAGEDFYFLQQLAKVTGVASLRGTVVYPSPRRSRRTPFGTGRSVARIGETSHAATLYYDPRCYAVLRRWLQVIADACDLDSAPLLQRAAVIDPALEAFLVREGLATIWPGLRRNHSDAQRLRAAAHGWFDGLRTVRLMHFLTENHWPRQAASVAVAPLMREAGLPAKVDPAGQLEVLRRWQIGDACDVCRLSGTLNYCRVGDR